MITEAKTRTENLCDTCQFHFATCDVDRGIVEFGEGTGGDNVILCDVYEPRPKAKG